MKLSFVTVILLFVGFSTQAHSSTSEPTSSSSTRYVEVNGKICSFKRNVLKCPGRSPRICEDLGDGRMACDRITGETRASYGACYSSCVQGCFPDPENAYLRYQMCETGCQASCR